MSCFPVTTILDMISAGRSSPQVNLSDIDLGVLRRVLRWYVRANQPSDPRYAREVDQIERALPEYEGAHQLKVIRYALDAYAEYAALIRVGTTDPRLREALKRRRDDALRVRQRVQ